MLIRSACLRARTDTRRTPAQDRFELSKRELSIVHSQTLGWVHEQDKSSTHETE